MTGSAQTIPAQRLVTLLGGPGARRGAVAPDAAIPPTGGWVPDQPSSPRPGRLGTMLGQGRHRPAESLLTRVVTVPAALRGAIRRPQPKALAAFAVLVVAVVAVAGVRVWWATQAAMPTPVAASGTPGALVSRSVPAAFSATASSSPSSGTSAASTPGGGTVVVHVAGLVRRPGVVRLPGGSRVLDAVTRCGGVARGADLSTVNLARVLSDGEQIVIAAPGVTAPAAGGSQPGHPGSSGVPHRPGGAVNLNTADAEALDGLPGVGPVLAERIIAWRTEHGRFSSVDELGEVSGIGERTLEKLRSLVTV